MYTDKKLSSQILFLIQFKTSLRMYANIIKYNTNEYFYKTKMLNFKHNTKKMKSYSYLYFDIFNCIVINLYLDNFCVKYLINIQIEQNYPSTTLLKTFFNFITATAFQKINCSRGHNIFLHRLPRIEQNCINVKNVSFCKSMIELFSIFFYKVSKNILIHC